jgi:hypothetical protein
MTLFKSGHLKIGKFYICSGYNLKRVAIGFSVDRWSINIDFLFFWFSIEL